MQSIKTLFHTVEKFTADNSPALLTAVGVVGTLSTAILTAKATWELAYRTSAEDAARHKRGDKMMTHKEVFHDGWKLYLPPLAVAAVTTTAIIGANRIGTRRAAALAAAYATSDKAFAEYKDEVKEILGDKKARELDDEVAQKQVAKNPPSESLIIGDEDTLFYDSWTGRYFKSTMETVKGAENHLNHLLNRDGDVSLNTFYSWLGLDTIPSGEELGWRFDKGEINLTFTSTIASNNKPAIVINFRTVPIRHESH